MKVYKITTLANWLTWQLEQVEKNGQKLGINCLVPKFPFQQLKHGRGTLCINMVLRENQDCIYTADQFQSSQKLKTDHNSWYKRRGWIFYISKCNTMGVQWTRNQAINHCCPILHNLSGKEHLPFHISSSINCIFFPYAQCQKGEQQQNQSKPWTTTERFGHVLRFWKMRTTRERPDLKCGIIFQLKSITNYHVDINPLQSISYCKVIL